MVSRGGILEQRDMRVKGNVCGRGVLRRLELGVAGQAWCG